MISICLRDSKNKLYKDVDSGIETNNPRGIPVFLLIITGMHMIYGSSASKVASSSIVVMILNSSDSTICFKYGDNQENILNGFISIDISSLGFWKLKSIPPKLFNMPSIESSGLMILFIFLDIVLGLNGDKE